MRFKNDVGPQVRRRRYALGWSQSVLTAKLQIAGFDISRSGVSKIEARLSYVDDKTLLYLAEVLKVQLQELFPTRPPGNRIYDFIEKLETTRSDTDFHLPLACSGISADGVPIYLADLLEIRKVMDETGVNHAIRAGDSTP